jgi:hypothetical protein
MKLAEIAGTISISIVPAISASRGMREGDEVGGSGRMIEGVNLIKIYCKHICEYHNEIPLYN